MPEPINAPTGGQPKGTEAQPGQGTQTLTPQQRLARLLGGEEPKKKQGAAPEGDVRVDVDPEGGDRRSQPTGDDLDGDDDLLSLLGVDDDDDGGDPGRVGADDDDDDGGFEGDLENLVDPSRLAGTLHTVKVDGEDQQVPYDELVKGYSRQAHFTRAMQALAEKGRQFEAHAQAVLQERQQYAVLLTRLAQTIREQTTTRTPEQWAQLKATDPVGYTMAREEEREAQEKIQAAERELQEVNARTLREQEGQRQQMVADETEKLAKAVPEWKNQKVAAKDFARMADYARGLGYTDDDLKQVFDHRLFIVLKDASAYAALVSKKQQLKPGRRSTTSAAPGSTQETRRRGGRNRKAAQEARTRAKATGQVRDAAAAIAHIL